MNHKTRWTIRRLGTLLTVAVLLPSLPVLADDDDDDGWASQQAVVELVDGGNIEQLNAAYGTTVLASIPAHDLYLLALPEQWTEEQFEILIEEDELVEEAELNHDSEAPEGQTQSFFVYVGESTLQGQYAWPRIDLPGAHTLSQGGGVVAVLDTGVDPLHPMLQGRLLASGYDFVNGTTMLTDSGNGIDDDGDGEVDELAGHGTFLAGLVAAVAPDAMILPITVLEADGTSDAFRVAQGIFHAVEHGASIINLSLGTSESNEMLELALQHAHEHGVVVVAAAGNGGVDEPLFPADDHRTIAVVATDANDQLAPFSNYGGHVTIAAPGHEVASALPGDVYGQWSGTSMATAIVSGSVALVRALDPTLGPQAIAEVLHDSAAPIDDLNPGFEGLLGGGRLDARAAVLAVAPVVPGDVDGDGVVDIEDLLAVITGWGECSASPCPGDATGDGMVDVDDLMLVLTNWD